MEKSIEFGSDANGDLQLLNTPGNIAAFSRCVVDLKTVQAKFDSLIMDILLSRWEQLKADDEIKKRLERRVEVAVSNIERQIEHSTQEAVSRLVAERAKSIVSGMRFDVEVLIKAKEL